MTRPKIPEEVLAAFLDGTLAPKARRRVLERAASDPEVYRLLVHSSGTLGDLDATGGRPAVGRRAWRQWSLVGLAAAAALAIVLVNPFGDDPADAGRLLGLAGSIATAELPGGSGSLSAAPWQATRGGSLPAESSRLVRAGVRLADLGAARAAGDGAATAAAARDAAREMEGLLGAGPAVSALASAAEAAGTGATGWRGEAASAAGVALEIFDGSPLRLGLWLETVRLAALAGDVDLLRSARLTAAGRALAEQATPATAAGIRAVVDVLAGPVPPEPDVVLRWVDGLLTAGPVD